MRKFSREEKIALALTGIGLIGAAIWLTQNQKESIDIDPDQLANRLIEHYPAELVDLAKQDFYNLVEFGVGPETAFNVLVESLHA